MKGPDPLRADKMKLRNAQARLNEILAEHPRNTAKRRQLIREFWNSIAESKLRAPNTMRARRRI
jgi:DNA-binding response OmpR family regulator